MVQKTEMVATESQRQMELNGHIDRGLQRQMDKLNDILERLVETADNQCQKGRRGSIPSSPMVNKARGTIRILRLIMRRWKEKGKKSRLKMIRLQRLAKKCNDTGRLSFSSVDAIREAQQTAYRHYHTLRPYAQHYREMYLGKIAEEMSFRDGRDADHHFRNLMEQEEVRRQNQRIKIAEGRSGRRGVDMVERDIDGRRIRLTDKLEIEEAIITANKDKLLQADNTHLRMAPLHDLVGEQMDFEKWEEILQGNITLPEEGVEEGTRLWCNFITNQKMQDFVISWTQEEYFESWKKMPEDKSSAPGIHVGHLKCIDPCSNAAYVVSTLALLPMQTGYAPNIWRIGIDSMIPKKFDDLRPEKLILILLMDARFNHNNKLIGKKIWNMGRNTRNLQMNSMGVGKISHQTNTPPINV